MNFVVFDPDYAHNYLFTLTLENMKVHDRINVSLNTEDVMSICYDCENPYVFIFNAESFDPKLKPIVSKSVMSICLYKQMPSGQEYEQLKELGVQYWVEKPVNPLKLKFILNELNLSC